MKRSKRRTTELGLAPKCSLANCTCEGTKAFADHAEEQYCSDCYEAIRSIRLVRVVPR